jgi:hypothetical protein
MRDFDDGVAALDFDGVFSKLLDGVLGTALWVALDAAFVLLPSGFFKGD